jgi:2-polyprenyl-3-methyl-5-hydroxy-6-metoxy-1,4-benzoquinol methylase
MIDDLARTNQERWTALVEADVAYARPLFDLDEARARTEVDAQGILGDVAGKDVLCLASGGGQQSVAFALLGANVTVTDLTPAQLEKDRLAAAHHKVDIQIVQADMRDLSAFAEASFDIVWHAYSINFVPSVQPVFAEVARVLRPGLPSGLAIRPICSRYNKRYISPIKVGQLLAAGYGNDYTLSESKPSLQIESRHAHRRYNATWQCTGQRASRAPLN